MSENATPPVRKSSPFIRGFVDYAPLAVWAAAFATNRFILHHPQPLVAATWWLVGGSVLALAVGWIFERRIAPLPLMAGLAAVAFGILTLAFNDPVFIKVKPTIVNLFFATVLFGGLIFRRLFLKDLIGEQLLMADTAWRQLTIRYGVFFLFQAALNEAVWRTQPEDIWVLFRFPGLLLITVVFTLAMVPFMMKHGRFGEGEPKTPDLPPSG